MKQLNVTFEDREHKALSDIKKDTPWRQFFLDLIDYQEDPKHD